MILQKLILSMIRPGSENQNILLACNHTKDSPSEDGSAIWFGLYDHVFQKIFGEKWWCPCHVHPHIIVFRMSLLSSRLQTWHQFLKRRQFLEPTPQRTLNCELNTGQHIMGL